MDEQEQQNIVSNEQQPSESVEEVTSTPSSRKKLIIGILAGIAVLIAIGVGSYFFQYEKSGYYTYGESCTVNNDCKCVGSQEGITDVCGKPGQFPACIDNVCGWGWEGDLTDNLSEIADTSDWKTYRNEEYEFEFQYPNLYTVIESEAPDIRTVTIIRESDKDKPSNVEIPFLGIYTFKNPNDLTVVEWCNEERSKEEQQLVCQIIEIAPQGKIRKEIINGVETIILGAEDSPEGGYVFSKNGFVFELLNYELLSSDDEVLQILSTFKFIESTISAEEKYERECIKECGLAYCDPPSSNGCEQGEYLGCTLLCYGE